ncbi:MAG: class I SAM-dependent methyltransferase [Gammaproteobacteria bacterium]|jgi:2-polyprenyl-3-methyl-5-hydroxy-6-metoxy-1,4-benzoquinol methylase
MPAPVIKEHGIPVGNVYDKYHTRNPIARYLVGNFLSNVLELVRQTGARDIHEVGCGEGHLSQRIAGLQVDRVRGSDMSEQMIALARTENQRANVSFEVKDVYRLDETDAAELIVCCEVLEHLDDPRRALERLAALAGKYCILSVPREPMWRCLNMLRGKYIGDLGNTPGHIQHWSRAGFRSLIGEYFDLVEVRSPVPWTIALCRPRP